MLYPYIGNLFVSIFSVCVQRYDAFIRVQKGPQTTRQVDIKSQEAHRKTDKHTYIHIILSLRVFEPMVCSHMRCAQLWSAQMNFYYQFIAVNYNIM